MALNLTTLNQFINGLSLIELQTVEERVTARRKAFQHQAIRPGSIVSFKDRNGATRRITVDRVNQKSLSGDEVSTGRTWRVGLALCTPEKDYTLHVTPVKTVPGVKGAW